MTDAFNLYIFQELRQIGRDQHQQQETQYTLFRSTPKAERNYYIVDNEHAGKMKWVGVCSFSHIVNVRLCLLRTHILL